MGNRCNTQRYHNSNRIVRTKIIEIAQLNVKASEWVKKKTQQQHIAIRLCDLYLEMLQRNSTHFGRMNILRTIALSHLAFDTNTYETAWERQQFKIDLKNPVAVPSMAVQTRWNTVMQMCFCRALTRVWFLSKLNRIESSFNCFSFIFSAWKVGLYLTTTATASATAEMYRIRKSWFAAENDISSAKINLETDHMA